MQYDTVAIFTRKKLDFNWNEITNESSKLHLAKRVLEKVKQNRVANHSCRDAGYCWQSKPWKLWFTSCSESYEQHAPQTAVGKTFHIHLWMISGWELL